MPQRLLLVSLMFLLTCTACSEDDAISPGTDPAENNNTGENNATNNSNSANNASNNSTPNNAANNAANNSTFENNSVGLCGNETAFFEDIDGDGFGDTDSLMRAMEPIDGFAPASGDCALDDASRNPDAHEICNDILDDDCDGEDMECPTTQANDLNLPGWDCNGDAPANVYAWAKFEQGNGYYQDGGCFVFFEGLPGEFYVQHNLEPIAREGSEDGCLDTRNGCVCPSGGTWPSYDRRLYAFTRQAQTDDCPEISVRDHAGEEQVVSNKCRKYLYQLHFYDIPYSYIASGTDALEDRLAAFPQVEVACAEDAPHANLPYASLMTTNIMRNDNFSSME